MISQLFMRVLSAGSSAFVACLLAFLAFRHFSPELAIALDMDEALFIWVGLSALAVVFGVPLVRTYLMAVPIFLVGWSLVAAFEATLYASSGSLGNGDGEIHLRDAVVTVLLIATEAGHRYSHVLFGVLDENHSLVAFLHLRPDIANWIARSVLTGVILLTGVLTWIELRSWRVGREYDVPSEHTRRSAAPEFHHQQSDRWQPPQHRGGSSETGECPRCLTGRCRPH
jgi:hypothetical protein